MDKKIADDILRKFDGLIKKIELCKILNINIPYSQDELNKSVNAHRIDVVHRGLTPTYKNAKVAIEISTDVVEKITPLV